MKCFPIAAMAVVKGYFNNKQQRHSRIVQLSKVSVLLNAIIALGKIAMGLYSFSLFFCVSELYNVGIGSAKAVAIKGYSKSKKESDRDRQSKSIA